MRPTCSRRTCKRLMGELPADGLSWLGLQGNVHARTHAALYWIGILLTSGKCKMRPASWGLHLHDPTLRRYGVPNAIIDLIDGYC